jgi:isopenicillin N synthase-like dioxygenase
MNIPGVNLPLLSLPTDSRLYQNEVRLLVDACSKWGFVYLTNVPKAPMYDEMLAASRQFFRLPLKQKMALATRHFSPANKNRYRGYFPLTDGNHAFKEGFEVGWQHYQKTGSTLLFDELSVWPGNALTSGWENLLKRYFASQLKIGRCLLRAFEYHFDLPADHLIKQFNNTLSTLRLLHYPALDNAVNTSELERSGSKLYTTPTHTDSGILTLLLQDESGGLEVRHASGRWVEAPHVKGSLIMNIGDLLERWTDGAFKATEHRVQAPTSSRYSVPFFLEPGPNAIIKPFNRESQTTPILYQTYLSNKISSFVEYQSETT